MNNLYSEKNKDKVLGVLLAGGLSTRMGSDKKLLNYKGKSLIERAIHLLSDVVGEKNIIVSGYLHDRIQSIPDSVKNLGPVGGLLSVLDSKLIRSNDKILLIPVDMPGLTTNILHILLSALLEDNKNSCMGFKFTEKELPVVLRVKPELRVEAMRLCELKTPRRERSLHNLWKALDLCTLARPQEFDISFRNVNTPEDWGFFLEDRHEFKIL